MLSQAIQPQVLLHQQKTEEASWACDQMKIRQEQVEAILKAVAYLWPSGALIGRQNWTWGFDIYIFSISRLPWAPPALGSTRNSCPLFFALLPYRVIRVDS